MLKPIKYKLVRFVTYPGSGTHMLIDIFNTLKLQHLPIYDLLFKIFQVANGVSQNEIVSKVKRKRIFLKITNEINFKLFSKEINKIFSIIDETIFKKLKNNYYIIKPDLDYDLPEFVSFINNFFSLGSKYIDIKNIAYIRHPNSILISKTNRFSKLEDKYEIKETKRINDFFLFNRNLIEKKHIKFENLNYNFQNELKKLYLIFELDEKKMIDNFKIYHAQSISNINIQKKNFEKINYLENIYKAEPKKNFISSNFINYIHTNLNQIKVIFNFIIRDNLYSDAYFNRTRRHFIPKVILYILLLIKPIKKKYNFNMKKILDNKEKTFYI